MTSNIAQSYPYTTEPEPERSAAIVRAVEKFAGLADKIAAETDTLPDGGPDEPGRPQRFWVYVCPLHVTGRLHVVGHARERHAMYVVCDEGGETHLR